MISYKSSSLLPQSPISSSLNSPYSLTSDTIHDPLTQIADSNTVHVPNDSTFSTSLPPISDFRRSTRIKHMPSYLIGL